MAGQLAMWDGASLVPVLVDKAKSLKDPSAAKTKLESATMENLRKYHGAEHLLRRELLTRVAKHAGIELSTVATVADLDQIGLVIERRAVTTQRKVDKTFEGTTTHELVAHVLRALFDSFSEGFATMSEAEQERVVAEMIGVIDDMPEEYRERFKSGAGIDRISDRAMRQAIATGALGAGFAAVVQVAGFSAYMFATKALATIVGVVGLTLPFAAYVSLTSAMAFMTGPAGWVLLASAGLLLGRHTNRRIRNSLLPLIVAQTVVAAGKSRSVSQEASELVDAIAPVVRPSGPV